MNQKEFLHTSSTMLNLALTGKAMQGYPLGGIVNLVGDSATGKTLLAMSAAALAQQFPPTPSFQIAFDVVERGMNEEFAQVIGLDTRALWRPKQDEPFLASATIEDFYNHLEKFLKSIPPGNGGLYILDSLDALTCGAELARGLGDATYGTEKARLLSEFFRRIIGTLVDRRVTLLIISQVRENISARFGAKYKRAGGKALDFYADQVIWLAVKEKYTQNDLPVGYLVSAKVTKNRYAPPFRQVTIPIYFHLGVDDVSSILFYLAQRNVLQNAGGWWKLEGFEKSKRFEEWVSYGNTPDGYRYLVSLAQREWEREAEEIRQAFSNRLPVMSLIQSLQSQADVGNEQQEDQPVQGEQDA